MHSWASSWPHKRVSKSLLKSVCIAAEMTEEVCSVSKYEIKQCLCLEQCAEE